MYLDNELILTTIINKDYKQHNLKCKCGCDHFSVFYGKQEKSLEEKQREEKKEKFLSHATSFEGYIGKDGKIYTVRKFLGIPFGKMCEEVSSVTIDREVVKIKCVNCLKEIIIFDNYQHGYSSFEMEKNENLNIIYETLSKAPIEVCVKLYYSLSKSETDEIFVDETYDYSNCFTSISIYKLKDGKNKKIYDFETD